MRGEVLADLDFKVDLFVQAHADLAIRHQLGDLDRKIERETENFWRAPSEVLDLVGEKLTALKHQRDHGREQLRAIEAANGPTNSTDDADEVVARLRGLDADQLNAEPAPADARSIAS